MSSASAWSAVDLYFNFLNKTWYPQIFTWDSKTQEFSVQKADKKSVILWTIAVGSTLFNYMFIPLYILLSELFAKHTTVSLVQILFLILFFFGAMHGIPCMIKALTDGKDLTRALNHLIQLERIIKDNQVGPSDPALTKTIDKLACAILIDGFGIFFIAVTGPFVLYLADLDPLYHLLPENSLLNQAVRIICAISAHYPFMTFISTVHIIFLQITETMKILIRNLRSYEQVQKQGSWKSNGVKRGHFYLRSRIRMRPYSDLQIYSMAVILNIFARQYIDLSAAFIMGTGFVIDVVVNYAVISINDQVPFLLYVCLAGLAVIAPMVIMGLIPQAASSYEESSDLVFYWAGIVSPSMKYRQRVIKALIPCGFNIGIFFRVERSTTSTYIEALLDYTTNAVLSI